MKKILSHIMLILLILSSNPGWSLAMEQTIAPLEREKDRTETILENLTNRVDTTLERADNRISDPEQSEKIQEKQEEIQELLEEVRVTLEEAGSKSEVKEILEETKDIIVLKTAAALTPSEDITEDPVLQKLGATEKAQAENTLLSSLDSGEKNIIMIQSRSREDIIREKLARYDSTLTMDFQFAEDGYRVYEISVAKNSLLSEELLENLDQGEIPDTILGIEIIRPELLQIGTIDFTGEERARLWGIEQYTTPTYLESLEAKSATLPRKIRVGIIDTGIESNHRDLVGQVNTSLGYDFVNEDSDPTDDQGHGTHVAGTIAGKINSTGVFGVNPYVELVGLKICDNKGFCPSYSVLKALSYAKEHDFDVLNMSLGARGNPETSPICSAVKDITAGGTIVVAAAGNSNVDTSTFVPGGCSTAITVAAVDESGKRAAFSNYGAKVDVAAPGVGIYSSYIGGGYKSLNGTSMATPHIVGLISIIKMYRRDIRTDESKSLLKTYTKTVISDTNKPIASGVDVAKLISNLAGLRGTQEPEKKVEPLVIKEEQKTEVIEKSNTSETQKESTGSTEESIAIIDESIGLIIQNSEEKVEINSVSEGETTSEENTVRINSDEGDDTNPTEGESETIGDTQSTEYTTESVEINSAEAGIDFDTLDLSGALTSDGVAETSERISIDIDPVYIPESTSVEINSDGASEELPIALTEGGEESTSEDTGDTMIQNTYYCRMYVGGSCGYSLPAASIRQYQSTNSSLTSLSVGSNSFTLYGRQVGSATLYVKYNGRVLATVYVTVTQPINPLRVIYGSNNLMVGGSTYLTISSGNGGYSVTSSNPSIVSVSGYNTNWTLSGRGAGSATISYRDSRGQYGSFTITVTAPARDIRATIGASTIEVGKTTPLTITDGNGGYSVTSSNPSVASVSGANTSWSITARTPGTTTLTLRDSRGKYLSINLTILTASRTLRYSYGATTINIGSSSVLSVTDGNGGYSVTSSNPSVASVSGTNTSWSIRGVSAGTVNITLRDSRGKSATITYTILAPLRQVKGTLSNTSPRVGDTIIFTVTDGNGGYSVISSNPSILSVISGTDKNWTLRANAVGQATITVTDNRNSRGTITVNVISGSKSLTLSTNNITLEEGSVAYFQIISGNGGYRYSTSTGNVGWYYVDSSIPSFRIRGLSPGTNILQIRDSAGKVAQVKVEVKPKIITTVITNLQFSPSIQDEGMGGIYFEVDGGYREAGIEYHYGDRLQPIVEKFIPQPDDSYALVYSLDCADKTSCKVYLKPYVIDNTGKKIYHKNYDGTNYISVGYDSTGTKIANADESGVEVNGIRETVASLKQIGINVKRVSGQYKGVYDGGYDAVNDQLTELKSLLDTETYKILAREIKQLATKIMNGNFDIKSYLSKFRADFAELAAVLDTAYSYLGQLTSYDKQYYGSYLSVSSAVTFIGPGKLKGTKALKKIEDKAVESIQKGRAVVLAKGIKSIDPHVFTKHVYGSTDATASTFLQGANIESVIKEGYAKPNRKFAETMSGTRPSIKVEVDMGRQIGVTNNKKNTNLLRIIVDYDGNVISSYPIDYFSIN